MSLYPGEEGDWAQCVRLWASQTIIEVDGEEKTIWDLFAEQCPELAQDCERQLN